MHLFRGGGCAPTFGSGMVPFRISLLCSIFFCTTVFGMMLFTATVVMPGFAKLPNDGEYLRAFQSIDGIIQKNQAIFLGTWVGALLSLLVTCVLGSKVLDDWKQQVLLFVLALVYFSGHASTMAINVPLNNKMQALSNIENMTKLAQQQERFRFQGPWIRANWYRVVAFGISSFGLALFSVFIGT